MNNANIARNEVADQVTTSESQDLDSRNETSEESSEKGWYDQVLQNDGDEISWCDSVSQIKLMRQKALTEEIKSKLTSDELEEEKETERMQLEKIFQLLREQEDKFQVSSIEEVKDQLNLYRL